MSTYIFSTRSSVFRAASLAASTRYFVLPFRLLSTLAVLEHKGGKVLPQSLPVITAATRFGGDVTVFLAGTDAKSVAEQVAKLNGITKVLTVSDRAYDKVCTPRPHFSWFAEDMKRSQNTILLEYAGELCAVTGGEYQAERVHTCCVCSLSVWEEYYAQIVCSP